MAYSYSINESSTNMNLIISIVVVSLLIAETIGAPPISPWNL